jgi:hypothetical protein
MTSETNKPLPGALFLALIPVAWLGLSVIVTGLEGTFGIFPSRYAAALKSFHDASPALLTGWGITAAMAVGALLTRGRRPYVCALFMALFLVGYAGLAPAMYQRVAFGVWLAGIDGILVVAGTWQLTRDRGDEPNSQSTGE